MLKALFSNSIMSRLSRNELSFEDIMSEDQTLIRAIKREEPNISAFIAKHADDLIDYALGNDPSHSVQALKIISQENRKIISALCKCDRLKEPEDVDDSKLPVFSRILFTCISTFPETLYHEFQEICQYIDYIEHSCILSLFEDLIKSRTQIPTMLADLDFIPELIERFTDENSANIFKLFELCARNEFLASDMTSPLNISFILESFCETNSNQWRTIILLLPKFEDDFFDSLVPKAISVLSINGSRYDQYQVEAINFLIEYFKKNRSSVQKIDIASLLSTLIDVYQQFPNHSIVLISLFHLVSLLVSIAETRKLVLSKFFPVLNHTINSSDNIVQLSLSFDFCRQIRDLCMVDDEVDEDITNEEEFLEICRTKVNEKDGIIEREYGGKHNRYSFSPCISIDDLGEGPIEIE